MRWMHRRLLREVPRGDLGRSAMVFSPHFDDETLGCGGTILKKRRAGADVKIVFMTDGGKSHPGLMAEEELRAIRAREAGAAGRCLGLESSDLLFLGFQETKLKDLAAPATEKVKELIRRFRPPQVFVPYSGEPGVGSEDHGATHRIVSAALRESRRHGVVYEYPIWLWRHWPWVRLEPGRGVTWRSSLIRGYRLLRDFRWRVEIGDLLGLKRAALDRYGSQMTRLVPGPDWPTLGDVSDGEFLECFFQGREIFRRSSF